MKKLLFLSLFIFLISNILAKTPQEELALIYNQGEIEKAITFCKEKLQESKNKEFYYLNLAFLYEEKGELSQAISILKKAYSKYKSNQIIFHLGRLYLLSSFNKESIYFLKKYISKNPKDKRAYFYLGLNYEDLGNERKAERYYKKALSYDPYFILPLLRISEIYFKEANLVRALEYLKKIEEIDPSIKSTYKKLALLFFDNRDYLSSLKQSSKFLDIEPRDKEMQIVFNSSRKKLGKDFFKREREKIRKIREQKKIKVSSFVKEKGVSKVRVCIAEDIEHFEFKVLEDSVIFSQGIALFSLEKNKLYRLSLGKSLNSLDLMDSYGRIILSNLKPPLFIEGNSFTFLFGIFGIKYAQGSFWSKTLDNFFRGDLEIRIKNRRIFLINILNLEEYLYGVLPSEVSSNWPRQALYAQAILARTKAWRELSLRKRKDYDFSNTVRSQVYLGASREKASTNSAVDKTRGIVIVDNAGSPLDIFYSSNCGGHTQSFSSFVGIKDADANIGFDFPLTPFELYNWVTQQPPVFCKVEGKNKSKFRWQRFYYKKELDRVLERNISLKDIERFAVLKRDISGHINSLKIVTKEGEKEINSEFKIREVLDDLRSSLFRVEIKYSKEKVPQYFIFWGGGFGHGKGLCQYGAKGMAEQGYSFKEILKHYFSKTSLKKVY